MKRIPMLALAAMLAAMLGTQAQADLILEFDTITMSPGSNDSIDLFIRSDGTSSDSVGFFELAFQITKISGNGILNFRPSFDEGGQDNLETLESNYIFAGDSRAFNSTRNGSNARLLTQSDFSFAGRAIPTTFSDRLLIARLELDHDTDGSQSEGVFQIHVTNASSFTASDLSSLVPINRTLSTFGTVNINAVPEPSSAMLMTVGLATLVWRRKRRLYSCG